jgi:hypothetical protein
MLFSTIISTVPCHTCGLPTKKIKDRIIRDFEGKRNVFPAPQTKCGPNEIFSHLGTS